MDTPDYTQAIKDLTGAVYALTDAVKSLNAEWKTETADGAPFPVSAVPAVPAQSKTSAITADVKEAVKLVEEIAPVIQAVFRNPPPQ